MQEPERQHTPDETPQEPEPGVTEKEPGALLDMADEIKPRPEQRPSPTDEASEPGHSRPQRRGSRAAPAGDSHLSLLPPGGLRSAIITGIIAGVLTVLINVAITLLNTPLFQQALREGKNLTLNTALPLLGMECLNFFVSLLICFVAGFVVGRIAVRRQLGFIAGLLTGIINYLGSFVVRYIPGYPGNMASSAPGGVGALTGGIVIVIIFLLIWAMIGGLVGLWGTWTASRRHPYYRA